MFCCQDAIDFMGERQSFKTLLDQAGQSTFGLIPPVVNLILRELSGSQFVEDVPKTSEMQKQVNGIVNLMGQEEIPESELLALDETRIDSDIQFGIWKNFKVVGAAKGLGGQEKHLLTDED